MELNVENIFIKYMNSSKKWLLAIPVVENGQLKLRCFMTKNKELTGTFQNCYTYNVTLKALNDFYSYKSQGQAYNELIKNKKARTGFFNQADHVQGFWTMSDIKNTIITGRTVLVCEAINHSMNLSNNNFTLEPITENDKKARKLEKEQLNKIETLLQEV